MKHRKKVLIFLFKLAGGGAERTVINIINEIDKSKFEPILVLGNDTQENDYSFLIPEGIKIIVLKKKKLRHCTFSLSKVIRTEKPDLLFTTMHPNNIILYFAMRISLTKVPVILREANTRSEAKKVTIINKFITKHVYNNSNKVVSLSKGVKLDMINSFKVKEEKIEVIYNPINIEYINKKINDTNLTSFKKNTIISVGRLSEQKDFKTLISAFEIVNKEIDSELIILGKGVLEKELVEFVNSKKLQKKVHLKGFQENPYSFMSKADVFVLTSKWEGFGHVIVEAMVTGTPVIATDCKSGPSEIIKNNQYGILVEVGAHKQIAKEIKKMLLDEKSKEHYRNQGLQRSQDFDSKKIIKKYEKLFSEVMTK